MLSDVLDASPPPPPPPPPGHKMPFTYVVNVYSDMSLSKGHLWSRLNMNMCAPLGLNFVPF